MSIHASGRVERNAVGELVACFGVEVQAVLPAPGEEVGRVMLCQRPFKHLPTADDKGDSR